MYTITNVGGTPGGEAFLLVTEEKAALIDSGFACSAGRMVANIKDILQDRPLDYAVSYTHLERRRIRARGLHALHGPVRGTGCRI